MAAVIDNWPIYFLSQRPLLILIIAVLAATGAYSFRRSVLSRRAFISSAFLWCAYCLWEVYMLVWRSPTGDMAIRTDALFIEPAMQMLLLGNVLLTARCLTKRR